MKEYITFASKPSSIPEGEEIDLLVMDQGVFQTKAVRAIVHKKALKDLDRLWIRSPLSIIKGEWSIRIVKEYEDERLMDPNIFRCEE